MRGQRRGAARLGTGALVAGLLGAFGLLAASPASAAVTATINSPDNKATYGSYQKLSVDATVNYGSSDSGTATLTATDPDYTNDSSTGCAFAVGQSSYGGPAGGTYSADVAGPLDLAAAYPKSCGAFAGKPAVNGKWTITLSTTSGAGATSTFTSTVPPVAPAGVKGSSGSPLAVTISWTPNPEPDTHAYAVLNASGGIVSGPTDAASLCSASSCSASFGVSQSGSQGFSVRAYRYAAPPAQATFSTAGDLTTDSSAQNVNVAAKPGTASASPTPSSGSGGGVTPPTITKSGEPTTSSSPAPGSSSSPAASAGAPTAAPTTATSSHAASSGAGSSGASVSGGTVTLHNTASAGEAAKISAQFHNFAAPAGIDKLPPLPKLNSVTGSVTGLAPAAASDDGEPTDDGTFKPTLGYAPQTTTVVTHSTTAGALGSVADAFGISTDALWRSLAGSLVLLLCAGHVRRWARQPIE